MDLPNRLFPTRYFEVAMSINCSSFHTELVSFLHKDARERILREGFHPDADPQFKAFQRLIAQSTASSEVILPWTEIVDQYHGLFEAKGDLRLEASLFNAFAQKDAKEHGLRMYRGLPRLYQADRPSNSKLKKYFSDLATLKRLAVEKSAFRIYDSFPLPEFSRVSFFTWVSNWDDYAAGCKVVETIEERFPELELSWIVLVPSRKRHLRIPKGCKTHLIVYEQKNTLASIEKEALEILRTSDLVLQIPTYFPLFRPLQEMVGRISFSKLPPIWKSFGKHGSIESPQFHPRSGNCSMGLHFLEKGILIHRHKNSAYGFDLLENESLLRWLFGTSFPMIEQIQRYKETHHFYLADLKSPTGGAIYLHALSRLHERDHKDIDLCVPDLSWILSYIDLQNRKGSPVLEIGGIALELYFQEKVIPITTGAKKLRLFSPSEISQKDFRNLFDLSGEFVGIHSDSSFSEAVSANKGFFFDSTEAEKYFMKDLLALAENRIGMHRSALKIFRAMGEAAVHNFSLQEGDWVEESYFQEKTPWLEIAEKIGLALQDPDAIAGFKKLNSIITEEHPLNDFLCLFVQRELCHRACPDLAVIEDQALSRFASGERSVRQMMLDLEALKK